MQELLLKIEDACLQLNSATLTIPGGIAILLGLFLWLGGTRYAFLVAALLGAVLGAGLGLLIGPKLGAGNLVGATIGASVFALVAGLLHKVMIILMATLIFGLACATVYMGTAVDSELDPAPSSSTHLIDSATATPPTNPDNLAAPDATPDNFLPTDAHSVALRKLSDAWQTIKSAAQAHRGALIVWALAGAVVGMILAWLLRILVMAFCCSMVGSAAVMGGITALLLAKGTPVISAMLSHPRVTPAVFTGMLLFGWLTQLLLLGPKKDKAANQPNKE